MARKSKRIDHDALFKKLLTTFFQEFIELFLPEVANYLDFSTLKAVDKEIISRRKRTADIVMQAKYKGEESFFLIHVEHFQLHGHSAKSHGLARLSQPP